MSTRIDTLTDKLRAELADYLMLGDELDDATGQGRR